MTKGKKEAVCWVWSFCSFVALRNFCDSVTRPYQSLTQEHVRSKPPALLALSLGYGALVELLFTRAPYPQDIARKELNKSSISSGHCKQCCACGWQFFFSRNDGGSLLRMQMSVFFYSADATHAYGRQRAFFLLNKVWFVFFLDRNPEDGRRKTSYFF